MSSIDNKVALITGASRRIGASIATLFHTNGMNVILHCNNSLAEANDLCQLFNKQRTDSARVLQANLIETKHLSSIIDQAANYWGHLDIVINNAARFYPTPLEEASDEMWEDLITSNLKAPFFISQASIKYLRKTKGCIINITDIYASKPLQDHSIYCISKAGLVLLTLSLAKELGPDIRVNGISPGVILWPEGNQAFSEQTKNDLLHNTALKSPGEPTDIAKAALFLAMSDYVTGEVIAVDGGQSLF